MSIKSFNCRDTKKIWNRKPVKTFSVNMQKIARRKLILINVAEKLDDLRIPPNNQLKKYCGKKKLTKWSIRINDQWRICFYFENGDAKEVEIVDYH